MEGGSSWGNGTTTEILGCKEANKRGTKVERRLEEGKNNALLKEGEKEPHARGEKSGKLA